MAKKDKDKKDREKAREALAAEVPEPATEPRAAEQHRNPADAILGALGGRARAADLVGEVVNVAGRVREAIDDLRLSDEVRTLRNELAALRRRVADLEARAQEAPPPAPAPRRRTTKTAPDAAVPATTRRRTTKTAADDAAPATTRRRTTTTAADATDPKPRASGTARPTRARPTPPPTEPAPEADAGRS